MLKKDRATDIQRKAQALLDNRAENIRKAKQGLRDAAADVDQIERKAQEALEDADLDCYVDALSDKARAQAKQEIEHKKVSRAVMVTDEERSAAKEIHVELNRAIKELDEEMRSKLIEQQRHLRSTAITYQWRINELTTLRSQLHREFLEPGDPIPARSEVKLNASVQAIEHVINVLSDSPVHFN